MDGVIVVDKPPGLTSHDVVAAARRLLGQARIGHTGTLDPLATGVLPLACGRATRLVRFLSGATKDYEATIVFGVTTDTLDITGAETSRSGRCPTRDEIDSALVSLRGEYLQTPPAFSAKKVAGRRAYDLARRREPVTPAAVPVTVSRADLVTLTGDTATLRLTCSAGFYVRSFAQELGALVGTGACLAALRRTRSGEFEIAQAVSLAALQDSPGEPRSGWVPLRGLLLAIPSVRVTDEGRERIAHGREIGREHIGETSVDLGDLSAPPTAAGRASDEWVRVLDRSDELVAMARIHRPDRALQPALVLI